MIPYLFKNSDLNVKLRLSLIMYINENVLLMIYKEYKQSVLYFLYHKTIHFQLNDYNRFKHNSG